MNEFLVIILWILLSKQLSICEATLIVVKWNKDLGHFEPIPGSSTFDREKEKLIFKSRQEENYNFNKQALNFTYYQDLGFFKFYDNDTKVTGICADIWKILSKYLNFTMILTRNKENSSGASMTNGTFTGILEYARLNQTDIIPKINIYSTRLKAVKFTPAFWRNSYRIFTRAQWKRNRAWMFSVFQTEVWWYIFIFLVILSSVNMFTQKILIKHCGRRTIGTRSYLHYFFNIVAALCQQDHVQEYAKSGLNVLFLTISLFSWFILTNYSSHMIYKMTLAVFDPPFNDLETLYKNTQFRIIVLKGSMGHIMFTSPYTMPIFKKIFKLKRVLVTSSLNELYDKVCFNADKYVLFDADDSMEAKDTTICRLFPIGTPYYLTPIGAGISRRVRNKKTIDNGIIKLFEFGLLDALKKRYIMFNKETTDKQLEGQAIDMDRVLLIFAILAVGIIAAFFICVLENLHFTLKNPAKVKKLIQRSPFIMKPLLRIICHSKYNKN